MNSLELDCLITCASDRTNIETLATRFNVSRYAVSRALRALSQAGYVDVEGTKARWFSASLNGRVWLSKLGARIEDALYGEKGD